MVFILAVQETAPLWQDRLQKASEMKWSPSISV